MAHVGSCRANLINHKWPILVFNGQYVSPYHRKELKCLANIFFREQYKNTREKIKVQITGRGCRKSKRSTGRVASTFKSLSCHWDTIFHTHDLKEEMFILAPRF